jgi:GNAT superfamily N-acetyltransferase
MPLTLSLATEADLPLLVRAQYAAFHPTDTMHVLVYPSPHPVPESVIEKTVERQLGAWKENVTWVKVVDDETGSVVAGAKWVFWPEAAKEGEERWPEQVDGSLVSEKRRDGEREAGVQVEVDGVEGVQNAGKGVDDREYVSWVTEKVVGRRRERIQGPAALLDICYTHPESQGKGAGALLVQWGAKKADELGVRAFVEASYKGRRLYESFGFVVKDLVLLEGGSVREEWAEYGEVGYLWMEREVRVVKS